MAWVSQNAAIVIALLSLGISAHSEYRQSFNERHDLKGAFLQINARNDEATGRILISNSGTVSEVVSEVDIYFELQAPKAGHVVTSTLPAVLLKPGEVQLIDFTTKLPLDEGFKDRVQFGASFLTVDTRAGRQSSKLFIDTHLAFIWF